MGPTRTIHASLLRRLLPWLACAFAFIGFHLVWDYPTFLAPNHIIRGWGSDELFFCWDFWWVSTSFWEIPKSTVFHCPFLFAPVGTDYLLSSHTWLYSMMYTLGQTPWRLFSFLGSPPSPVLGYNLIVLLSSGLTGLAVVAICREFRPIGFPAALLAGFTAAFCDFRLFALFGHLNYMGMEFLLWGVWALFGATFDYSATSWKRWALGGVFGGLTWLNCYYYGIFFALFWLFCQVWHVRLAGKGSRTRAWNRAWITWAVVALIAGYHLFEMARGFFSPEYSVDIDRTQRTRDLFHFLLPSGYHLFLGGWSMSLARRLKIPRDYDITFLGWTTFWTLGWGIWFWASRRRQGTRPFASPRNRFWLWLGGLAFLLALGKRLSVFGIGTADLPAAILFKLPILENIRAIERLLIFVFLPVGLLAASIAQQLSDKGERVKLLVFVGGWIVLFLLGAAYVPRHIDTRAAPYQLPDAVLNRIRIAVPSPQARTVLTLPVSYDHRLPLFWQTEHHRPIPFGASSRKRVALEEWRKATYPVLTGIEEGHNPSLEHARREAGSKEALRRQVHRFLKDHRVGFVLVRRSVWPEGGRFVREALPGAKPAYSDDEFVLFDVRPREVSSSGSKRNPR